MVEEKDCSVVCMGLLLTADNKFNLFGNIEDGQSDFYLKNKFFLKWLNDLKERQGFLAQNLSYCGKV